MKFLDLKEYFVDSMISYLFVINFDCNIATAITFIIVVTYIIIINCNIIVIVIVINIVVNIIIIEIVVVIIKD